MKLRISIVVALALAGSTGIACRATDTVLRSARPTSWTANVREPAFFAHEPVLYARDGSAVSQDPPSSVATSTAPVHDVSAQGGSRMYLLDLYQKAMDEKDALALEVKSSNAALERAQSALSAAEKKRDVLARKSQDLEAELQRAQADNQDLAARLTTAQIRRLEAEKLLLEAKLEAMHAQESSEMPGKPRKMDAKAEGASSPAGRERSATPAKSPSPPASSPPSSQRESSDSHSAGGKP